MNIVVERNGQVKTIRVFGDINRNELNILRMEFADIVSAKKLLLDLSETDFAGTDFINFLVEMRHSYASQINKLSILNPNELIEDLLALSNLDKLILIEKKPIGVAVETI